VVGRRVGEVLLPQQSLIVLVVDEEGKPVVPKDDTVVRSGDELVAVTRMENEDALRAALTEPAPSG